MGQSSETLGAAKPNQVVVSPGGATFSSINAAINSITDASDQKQYVLYIGPGTYNEHVIMKPWVLLQGAGQNEFGQNYTIISAPAGNSDSWATVKAASNSRLSTVTVKSMYANPGDNMCACIDCTGVTNFWCSGVEAIASDTPDQPCNMFGIVNNRGIAEHQNITCSVSLYYCTFTAKAQNPKSFVMGLWAAGGGNYKVTSCTLTGLGEYVSSGAAANPGPNSNLVFTGCVITGRRFSLETSDRSTVTAIRCKLHGPVDQGVIVKN